MGIYILQKLVEPLSMKCSQTSTKMCAVIRGNHMIFSERIRDPRSLMIDRVRSMIHFITFIQSWIDKRYQAVPPALMNEIGFEDCYWVSFEGSFGWWKRFEKWYEPVELHLPCRDPIEHLMSQMNYRNKKMNCTSFQIEEVHKHFVSLDSRFSSKNIPKNMTLKCIHFDDQFGPYIESLGLTPKRYQQPLHVHHTNKDRNRENECIWRHDRLREKLRLYMIQNIDYYKFCDECNSWFPTRNDTR